MTRKHEAYYRSVGVKITRQNLDAFHDDGSSDYSVGRGYSWDNIAGHRLYVELRLLLDVERMSSHISTSSDEVHRRLIILVPH